MLNACHHRLGKIDFLSWQSLNLAVGSRRFPSGMKHHGIKEVLPNESFTGGKMMDVFSIWHLIIILLIVVALFGTTKLRNVGSDLGSAIKSFRSAVKEDEAEK